MAHVMDMSTDQYRRPDHEILDVFARRWSPRAMSGDPVPESELHRVFEAARWAPSSYNEQPWRFLYARRDTPHWDRFFGLLFDANKAWAARAGVLVVIVAKTTFTRNGNPNRVAVFDAGSAWQSMALQGASMGLVVHGMAGFDFDQARAELGVPADYDVCAMGAIGKPGKVEDLPEQMRGVEQPSPRRPIAETIMEGGFRA